MTRSDRGLRRTGLSRRFAAEFVLDPQIPSGFIEIWEKDASLFHKSLDDLHRRGRSICSSACRQPFSFKGI